jgi:hypothetical protein
VSAAGEILREPLQEAFDRWARSPQFWELNTRGFNACGIGAIVANSAALRHSLAWSEHRLIADISGQPL